MDCAQAAGLLTDYLEDAVPRRERDRFRRHLRGCRDCAAGLEEIRAVIRVAAGLGQRDAPPPQLVDGLVQIYRQLRAS